MISWFCRAIAVTVLLATAATSPISAQISPDKDWRSLRTPHFYVHFTPGLEALARRAAASAETAYVQLASELVPPRGPIDLVISDDADFSNGFASPFPTNRITIYANPPIQESALRFTDDWTAMVILHELTPQKASLEDAYMALTGDSVEYRASETHIDLEHAA